MAASSKKVIIAALIGNSLIAVTKFIAAGISGSSAMLSEGIHSLVDTGNQVLLLWGLKQSKRPPDAKYPFGHGKEIYFWCFSVAILIFAVGAGISIYEGIERLHHPAPIKHVSLSLIVLLIAMVFEAGAWWVAYVEFNKARGKMRFLEAIHRGKDPTLFVVLFEDSAAMLGLIVAFVGISLGHITGNSLFDGLASIMIGLILAGTAVWLAYETKSLLIGEAANKKVVQGIRDMVNALPNVLHVNEILTLHMGPDFILLNISVEFEDDHTADDIENVIDTMDCEIKGRYPEIKRIFIEAEASDNH